MAAGMFKMVPMSMLRVGTVLASPIFDSQNTKLLAAEHPITPELLEKLRSRGIQSVAIDVNDLARLTAFQPQGTSNQALPSRQGIRVAMENRVSKQLDMLSGLEMDLNACIKGDPLSAEFKPHDGGSYNATEMNAFLDHHQESISQVDGLLSNLASGDSVDLGLLEGISEETLNQACEDMDLFVCLGITPSADTYPGRHSVHTAMLAMSIGATLGLDRQSLVELGLGCMIHDAGMLRINEQSFQNRRVVGPDEFAEITKHPLRTFDLLERNLDQVPAASRMVAYQIHERCDGSGYPRGRTAPQIHPLAKIAGVADTFTALVSRRPYRPGMLPYHAMVKMLQDVGQGLYDAQIVRALLNTVSLFPIGSFVALNDGRLGKVVRSNGDAYDRPVLEVWDRAQLSAAPTIVDMRGHADLKVVRALARLD
jgi:HD-GYP domain-containing protein (c-di-GMP phosphodiesterase class II)